MARILAPTWCSCKFAFDYFGDGSGAWGFGAKIEGGRVSGGWEITGSAGAEAGAASAVGAVVDAGAEAGGADGATAASVICHIRNE